MAREAGLDHRVGPAALLKVRHLPCDHGLDLRRAHLAPQPHPVPLYPGRRAHHHDLVHARVAARFEQQRDVQHRHATPGTAGAGEEGALLAPHHRMNDGLEPLQRPIVEQYRLTQRRTVHGTVPDGARKRPPDRPHRPATSGL